MRPAFRIVPAALAAFVVALALTSSSVAHRSPPHPAKRGSTVSAHVPYIAPWQTGFEKFSTQVFVPNTINAAAVSLVIPDGQWWRIIYLNADYTTDNGPATRTMRVLITDASGAAILEENAPVSQPASATFSYLFGPGISSFSNAADLLHGMAVVAMPDALWPPKATVALQVAGTRGTDNWATLKAFAVEIYTEERPGVLVPKLTPTPLIP